MKNIVIVSAWPDPHVDATKKHILGNDAELFIVYSNTHQGGGAKLSFEQNKFWLENESTKIPASKVDSAWYRKPFMWFVDYTGLSQDESINLEIKQQEIGGMIRHLFHTLETNKNTLLINPYSTFSRAESKLHVLTVAKELGFLIPFTYVGADAQKVRSFLMEHNTCIVKQIARTGVRFGPAQRTFMTRKITLDAFDSFFSTMSLDYPILVQEEIAKDFELRITVVGDQIFACKIDSQKVKGASLDWRNVKNEELSHEVFTLPPHIKNLCLKLCNILNSPYGAIDMAVTPEGKYVFFEINPNGQYLWIEEHTGMPISKAIADLLMRGNGV